MNRPETLLTVRNLTKIYGGSRLRARRNALRAVDGVSFELARGETLGLVGESGSGKSTVGRMVLNLIRPTDGSVALDGIDVIRLAATRAIYRRLQIVFQDPHASLHPRLTVRALLEEPLRLHRKLKGAALAEAVAALLEDVGLAPEQADRYAHQFSGGQRQRIGIARALACDPDVIVCDEPVSALDVSVQAQIINLLKELQERRQVSYLFIAHDLAVVRHISHRVAVMYLGRIVEIAPAEQLFSNARHPYTQALLAAIPRPEPGAERPANVIHGEPPSPMNRPQGCAFRRRCPHAAQICADEDPALRPVDAGHGVACLRVEDVPSFAVSPPAETSPRLAALMRSFSGASRTDAFDDTPN